VAELQNRRLVEGPWKGPATEGNSPVDESRSVSVVVFPSSAGHVKSCVNLGGPPPKAKYFLATDSEPVP
jgi:hypothetical protein